MLGPVTSTDQPTRTGGDRCPGALRLHPAADGGLARMRVPGGLLTADQVDVLADAAARLGDGAVSLTARGNVEIRGLSDAGGAELGDVLQRAGALPSPTHERVRNVVVSPTAGLDGEGAAGDLVTSVRALDAALLRTPRAADLSGRFLFGLDDGRGDVLALAPDLAARWLSPDLAEIVVGGSPLLVADTADVPEALVTAACAFLDARDAAGETGWRLAELDAAYDVVTAIVDALTDAGLGRRPQEGFAPVPQHDGTPVAPGAVGEATAHLVLPLGTAPADTWRALAEAARRGDGLVRTTPWCSVLLARLDAGERDALLDHASGLGLVADPTDPTVGASACTGLPGCEKSRADVRGDLRAALAAAIGDGAESADQSERLPLHVSGCQRRCGHPRRAHLEAVAGPVTEAGEGAARPVYATGRADGSPATGAPLPDGRDDLTTLLAAR